MSSQSKNALEGGSHVSLAELIKTADKSSVIRESVILTCSTAIWHQLADKHLSATNVESDSNCYYRFFSVCINGIEVHHASRFANAERHINKQADTAFSADNAFLLKRAADIAHDGFWPGEDDNAVMVNCLRHTILVYSSAGNRLPLL